MLSNDKLKDLAEYIILSHTDDVEFLSVCEMLDDEFQGTKEYALLSQEEQHELALKLDRLVRSAIVTITFPEDTDAAS